VGWGCRKHKNRGWGEPILSLKKKTWSKKGDRLSLVGKKRNEDPNPHQVANFALPKHEGGEDETFAPTRGRGEGNKNWTQRENCRRKENIKKK